MRAPGLRSNLAEKMLRESADMADHPEKVTAGTAHPASSPIQASATPKTGVTKTRDIGNREPARQLAEIGLSNFAPYLMNRIMGRYNTNLRAELSELGLTTPKMRSLAVLSVMDGLQISELAVYAVVEQSTLSRALEQLSADGLVRRDPDPVDNRAIRISITDTGRDAFQRLWPSMARVYSRMFAGISNSERDAFVSTLQKILANVRQHDL